MAGIFHLYVTSFIHKAYEQILGAKKFYLPRGGTARTGLTAVVLPLSQEGIAFSINKFAQPKTAQTRHQALFFCPSLTFGDQLTHQLQVVLNLFTLPPCRLQTANGKQPTSSQPHSVHRVRWRSNHHKRQVEGGKPQTNIQ